MSLIKKAEYMSNKVIGIILIIAGILAFHLFGSQPETRAIWQNTLSEKIYTTPLAFGDNFVFLAGDKGKREYKYIQIDSTGKITASSIDLPSSPFDPIAFDGIMVSGDRARMVRGFSVPGLEVLWESATMQPFQIGPVKAGKDNFLIQSDRSLLFCLEAKTGKPVWDKTFTEDLVNYGADKTVVCIHGHTDVKNLSLKATGLDVDTGAELWTLEHKVNEDTPIFIQDICVLSSQEGETLLIDQNTGQLLYKHPLAGLKAVQILDDILIMLASGGSRLVCLSLMTGSSWTTTMQSGFVGAAKYGNRLLVADKKHLRCLDATSGSLIWNRTLEDVYNAFPFRNGIFVTHKDSFLARETYGSYIETATSESLWLAYDRNTFNKPLATSHGDLLTSYGGTYRMMQKAKSTTTSDPSTIPTPTINFWKDRTASESAKPSENSNQPDNEKPAGKKPQEEKQPLDDWGQKPD